METIKLDAIDRIILTALQKDSRISINELAEQTNLSSSPCWRRIKRLEECGLIEGYTIQVSRKKTGLGVIGFVQLQMENHTAKTTASFEQEVVAIPQVLSCHNLSGRYDYQLEIIGEDLETFSEFVRTRIRSLPGVREISTNFSLKEIKRQCHIPIELLK